MIPAKTVSPFGGLSMAVLVLYHNVGFSQEFTVARSMIAQCDESSSDDDGGLIAAQAQPTIDKEIYLWTR